MRTWLRRPADWLKVILGVSVLLRVAAAFYLGNDVTPLPGIADQVSYHTLAVRLLEGHGFTFDRIWWPLTKAGEPTAHWSYLYTLYLWAVYALFGVVPLAARLIQAVVAGILHPLLAFRLGKRVFGVGAGLAAAGVTAVYIYFIYYGAALMTEAFYITLILAGLDLSFLLVGEGEEGRQETGRRWRLALLLGLALGAVLLLRQVFLFFIPFLFLWIALKKRLFGPLALAGGVMTLVIAPVTLFNYTQFDRFVLLNTNAGFAFFWGNHPVYGNRFVPILEEQGAYQRLIPDDVRDLDEVAMERELMNRGMQFVFDDPGRYVLLSISRIPAYFQFWPSADSSPLSNLSRVGSFGLFLPFFLWGIFRGFPKKWSDPQTPLLVFVLVYSGVHLLTWGLVRYRLPVDAVLTVFAGPVFVFIGEKLKKNR